MHHFLFVGLGGIGQRHLRNVRSLFGSKVKVSAYRTRRETTLLSDSLNAVEGGNLEREYDVNVFDDLNKALAQRPNIAVIANPSSLHIPVARAALEANCDLLIEKPLSDSLEGIQQLINVASHQKRVVMVAYQLRFHPAVAKLIESVDQRLCGDVFGARAEVAEYLPNFHPFEDYRRMYASRRALGGGVTLTQIHEIDLLYRLFGVPETVYSIADKLSDLEIDVEDTATSLLQFRRADGLPFGVSLHQDYLGRPPRRSLSVWGSQGRLHLDLKEGALDWTPNEGTTTRLVDAKAQPRNELFANELRHFMHCVESREVPLASLEDGFESLKIALALKSSQKSHGVVPLPFSSEPAA